MTQGFPGGSVGKSLPVNAKTLTQPLLGMPIDSTNFSPLYYWAWNEMLTTVIPSSIIWQKQKRKEKWYIQESKCAILP